MKRPVSIKFLLCNFETSILIVVVVVVIVVAASQPDHSRAVGVCPLGGKSLIEGLALIPTLLHDP